VYYGNSNNSTSQLNSQRSNPYNLSSNFTSQDWVNWNVFVPTSGFYRITSSTSDLNSGQASIFVDDQAMTFDGGIGQVAAAGSAATGVVALTKGLHTIRIQAVSGQFNFNSIQVSSVLSAFTGNQPRYLSDMTPITAYNSWGPYERDMSNGEEAANDGQMISIAGQTFAKGLGVHSGSSLTYAIPADVTRFQANIGVDDEVGNKGSVVFQVYLDGNSNPAYTSSVLRGSQGSVPININVTGAHTLRLVVTDAGDGPDYDHADWANARFTSN
jgi:hypothetical protein